eukprot:275376-Chlamydomonas_euryale.AAC.1
MLQSLGGGRLCMLRVADPEGFGRRLETSITWERQQVTEAKPEALRVWSTPRSLIQQGMQAAPPRWNSYGVPPAASNESRAHACGAWSPCLRPMEPMHAAHGDHACGVWSPCVRPMEPMRAAHGAH